MHTHTHTHTHTLIIIITVISIAPYLINMDKNLMRYAHTHSRT